MFEREARCGVQVRRRASWALVLVMLIVGGCSSGDGSDGAASSDGSAKPIVSESGSFDSFEGFDPGADADRLTSEERIVVVNAEYRLVRRCMADAGFEYPAPPDGAVVAKATPFLAPAELRRSGYGFDWAAAARSWSSTNRPEGPADLTADMDPTRAKAFNEALSGPESGPTATLESGGGDTSSLPLEGCTADARAELFGSVMNALRYDRAEQSISGQAMSEALQEDEAYADAAEAWRACMLAAGQDPQYLAATNDYGFYALSSEMRVTASAGTSAVTVDRAAETANDDADCQESTGLYELRERLLPTVRDELYRYIDLESRELDAFSRAVFERAKDVE